MFAKTMRVFLLNLFNKIAINAVRALLILIAYIVKLTIDLLELGLVLIDWLAIKFDVRILSKQSAEPTPSLFTQSELEVMAMRLPSHVLTIEDIADFHSVSARQARKIKTIREDKININTYSVA